MKKVQKFKVNRSATILFIALVLISLVSYFLFSYYINIENALAVLEIDMGKIALLETFKEISLVILSVCGFNLLASVIIEVHSKNALISEVITNDVISAPEFYNDMEDDKKVKMFKALEQSLYFDSEVVHGMFDSIRAKLLTTVDDYYYEECDYVVSCSVHDSYIEKEITKKLIIKSYKGEYTIDDFCIGNFVGKKISGMISYELKSLEVDTEKKDINNDISYRTLEMNNLDEQNEYDTSNTLIYNKKLKVSDDKETVIVIKFISRTTVDDKSSTFRVVKPCKKFTLIYSLKQHEQYRLSVDAFGFLDNADESANDTSKSNLNITFNDWIFKNDGVVVTILDKKDQ